MNLVNSSPASLLRPSQAWRYLIFMRVCGGMMLFASLLAIYNLVWQKDLLRASLDAGLALVSLVAFLRVRTTKRISTSARVAYFIGVCSFITFVVLNHRYDAGLAGWVVLLPLLFYLSCGTRYGWRLTAGYVVILLAACSYKIWASNSGANVSVVINGLFAYLLVWLISHSYEALRYHQDKQLNAIALTDSLTGALNRLALKRHFRLYQHSPSWLLLLDVDNFKPINDRYGHDAGDKALTQLVQLLQGQFGVDQVFRLGGEEFALVCDNHAPHHISDLAQDLCRKIATHPIVLNEVSLNITVSIGIAHGAAGEDLSDLLRAADLALYRAKANGKNQAVQFPSPTQLELANSN